MYSKKDRGSFGGQICNFKYGGQSLFGKVIFEYYGSKPHIYLGRSFWADGMVNGKPLCVWRGRRKQSDLGTEK